MYDDNSRGLESPDRPVASTVTSQRLVTDGGTTWAAPASIQRDGFEKAVHFGRIADALEEEKR
ncbi:hypothetical protein AArcMg_2351 [Natrarchaeobaculum sulfurireducens]|uniref:Uncharacterized protein n=1 Tax=Natrarchaeobaculum sulfurireducens TaxID=2044521 RepID=A0A346PS50_9EURY|nr:hypothetical protein AArcMg_2351 [Natrarchaeobaculum sulfurireducens]